MSKKMDNLDELLECAIRETGAIRHMEELARLNQKRRMFLQALSYGAAACLFIGAPFGIDHKLSGEARKVGYAFIPADGQAGGSEITALMQDKKIAEAKDLIVAAKVQIEEEMKAPPSDDPEYLIQLTADKEELDLLEAVCLLREGRYFRAKKALKKITSTDGAFAKEAKELLKKL